VIALVETKARPATLRTMSPGLKRACSSVARRAPRLPAPSSPSSLIHPGESNDAMKPPYGVMSRVRSRIGGSVREPVVASRPFVACSGSITRGFVLFNPTASVYKSFSADRRSGVAALRCPSPLFSWTPCRTQTATSTGAFCRNGSGNEAWVSSPRPWGVALSILNSLVSTPTVPSETLPDRRRALLYRRSKSSQELNRIAEQTHPVT
jgi:hypothetical protein